MHRHPRRTAAAASIRLPAFCLFLCAAILFACSRFGGDDFVQTLLYKLTQSQAFVQNALAFELGIYAETPTVLSASIVDTGIAEDSPSESTYIPTTADSANSQEIPETSAAPTDTVKINNQTSLTYNLAEMLQNPVKIKLPTDGPQVLLIHTHSTEAYTQDSENTYASSEPSESQRTLDKTQSVIRVGDEVAHVLEANGISVVHCREVFDNPSFSGAYGRSLQAITEQLAKTPSIQVIIDIHRDSIVNSSGAICKTSCTIDGEDMAQLMLVMGSNASGLQHDNWRKNLNFAVNLQNRINAAYPSLMRPINLREQRFNEHMRTGSMLLEVGSSGNTLPEAISAAKRFAQVLADDLLGV